MSISGLALVLDPMRQAETLQRLSAIDEVTIGNSHGKRVAVVIETDDARAHRALLRRIEATPGVLSVSVVYASYTGNVGNQAAREV
jgi:nitrate reductase NapAB chaperone NapD